MHIGRKPSYEETPVEYDSLFIKQQVEYQYIRNKANGIMQTVLAVISIAVSLGFIRFLLSGGAIQRASIELSDKLVNRCSAEAITHSGVRLVGLGPTISITAVGSLILSAYLITEIWMANQAIQGRSVSLFPRHEVDYWTSHHHEWIKHNRRKIAESNELLASIQKKLYWSIGLALLCMILIGLVYYDSAIAAFIVGLFLIMSGIWNIVKYIRQHYISRVFRNSGIISGVLSTVAVLILVVLVLLVLVSLVWVTHVQLLPVLGLMVVLSALFYVNDSNKKESDRILDLNEMEDGVFHLRDRGMSPVFLSLLGIVLSYVVGKYILMFLLIDRFMLC